MKRKVLIILVELLVLLIGISCQAFDINNIFEVYKNEDVKLCFKQTSVNGMTGQLIERNGVLTIKAKKQMIFDYKNERIVIDDFRAIDEKDNKTDVYKLTGFDRVLFLMFIGKKNLNELFIVKRIRRSSYILKPKFQSNIDKVCVNFNKDKVSSIKITDIYANKIIYQFHDFPRSRAQKGD